PYAARRMDSRAAARLCGVGRGRGALVPRAQCGARGRLRPGLRRGQAAFRLVRGKRVMFYDAAKRDHGLPQDPLKSLIVPRPIGWISTVDGQGRVNLAPYSFYN